jgi:TatD DNase family protein
MGLGILHPLLHLTADYHYNLSPHDVQQNVLIRQLKLAISLNKPLVSTSLPYLTNLVHTREADDDILRILTTHVPRETHLHIHCFTDTPTLAASLISHFPNLFIGITGVITYSSNLNTTEVVKETPLERLLLETDSPFMTPNNVQKTIKAEGGKSTRLPVCWSGMIPWTAEWVANIKGESVEKVLEVTRENAQRMYGITV